MKRLLSAICLGLVSIILLTLFAACGGRPAKTIETSQSEDRSDSQETESQGGFAESEKAKFDENMLPLYVAEDFETIDEDDERVLALEEDFRIPRRYSIMWNQSDDLAYCGERLYGASGEYVFFCEFGREWDAEGYSWAPETQSYKGYDFTCGIPFTLWAYYEGKFYLFSDLVEVDRISDSVISELSDIHAEYEASKVEIENNKYAKRDAERAELQIPSDDVIAEMKAAWAENNRTELPDFDAENLSFGKEMKLYGTYNGSVVFAFPGDTQMPINKNVAGWRFSWGTAFEIIVYNDGSFCFIEDAFNQGLLTREDIANISAEHDAYYDSGFGQ